MKRFRIFLIDFSANRDVLTPVQLNDANLVGVAKEGKYSAFIFYETGGKETCTYSLRLVPMGHEVEETEKFLCVIAGDPEINNDYHGLYVKELSA